MRLSYFILTISIIGTVILTGCGEGTAVNNSAPRNEANTVANTQKPVDKDPTAVTTPTPDQVTNSAPTLTPVYKAFCAAVVKKDEAAIRKFYDSATLKSFEDAMKEDGIKTLTEFLKDDKISNETCEISNERIKGDKAVAKLRSGSCPNGCEVLFVKEGGEWKMSTMMPEKGF